MAYQPIDQYGLIGDMHTVALVAVNGSIDWMCMPRFDSPSLFCAILDDQKGGFFRIAPIHEDDIVYKQFYWPATNVLVTRFLSKQGAAELTDFMAVDERRSERRRLIRRITALRGRIEIRAECRPAFNFARDPHEVAIVEKGAEFHTKAMHVGLATTMPLRAEGNGVVAEFALGGGRQRQFRAARAVLPTRAAAGTCPRTARKRPSAIPWRSGGTGSRNAPTAVAGARWSAAPRWRSSF